MDLFFSLLLGFAFYYVLSFATKFILFKVFPKLSNLLLSLLSLIPLAYFVVLKKPEQNLQLSLTIVIMVFVALMFCKFKQVSPKKAR